ncbi:hypothetical protein V1477_001634 [Vespula maculifrons]|uniref:Uncharacterized protein n=1 Tax=Vespula maculifrons TaxID=7453 RepID=A0ABD2D165_VESMC
MTVRLLPNIRKMSHRVEVAALGDPRSNGDSTLKSTIRDAFPLRELRASQQTGDCATMIWVAFELPLGCVWVASELEIIV